MTHIHSVMLYHHGNKFVHKTYSTFNARLIKKSEIPKIRHVLLLLPDLWPTAKRGPSPGKVVAKDAPADHPPHPGPPPRPARPPTQHAAHPQGLCRRRKFGGTNCPNSPNVKFK